MLDRITNFIAGVAILVSWLLYVPVMLFMMAVGFFVDLVWPPEKPKKK